MDNKDIYRAAMRLIEQYGGDATIKAAMRVDAMIKAKDVHGVAVWKRILRAVLEVQEAGGPVKH